jgi:putative transcriptional regulator
MTEEQLLARDAKRDIGAELLLSVRQIKAGKGKVVARVDVPAVTVARLKSGLSRGDFANLLGVSVRTLQDWDKAAVSVRTLQDWEQGRRQPSGAARTLITIAEQQPKVLKQVLKSMVAA